MLAEVYNKLLQSVKLDDETPEGARRKIKFMMEDSEKVELNADIAIKAAEINQEMKSTRKGWGLADSIIYAIAITCKAVVVTGDEHFRRLPSVIMIKNAT